MEQHTPIRRRGFLVSGLYAGAAALAAAVLYPILAYLKPPKVTGEQVDAVRVGPEKDFSPGSGTPFRFGNRPGLLVRLANGEFHAFDATCTHLNCTVQFKKDAGIIWCACHNGRYDLSGRNIGGPPPKPLTAFKVVVKGGDVFALRA
jgi:Rieske Fe-S protein